MPEIEIDLNCRECNMDEVKAESLASGKGATLRSR